MRPISAGQTRFLNALTSFNWINLNQFARCAPINRSSLPPTRSPGTKVVLLEAITASAADAAIGIDVNTIWMSGRTTSDQFRWYGGTTLAATLTGTGNFTPVGNVTLPALQASTTYANDAAAATGGVAVGGLYRNGSVIQIRVA